MDCFTQERTKPPHIGEKGRKLKRHRKKKKKNIIEVIDAIENKTYGEDECMTVVPILGNVIVALNWFLFHRARV